MRYRIVFLILILPNAILGQNLIKNGAFTDSIVNSWPGHWSVPTNASPEFFQSTSTINEFKVPQNLVGFQQALVGNSYLGLVLYSNSRPSNKNFREYVQGSLLKGLIQDSTYCFQFYISLADSMKYAIKNNLGVYFSNIQVDSNQIRNDLLQVTPQIEFLDSNYFTDKQNWIKLSSTYKANGGEQFFVVGNFRPDSLLDTLAISGGKQFWMKATYYYLDNFWLSHCDSLPDSSIGIWEQQAKHQLKLYPNPSNGLLNLESEVLVARVKMYDVQGRLLQIIKQPAKQIELPQATGIYLLRLELENGEVLSRKVIKN